MPVSSMIQANKLANYNLFCQLPSRMVNLTFSGINQRPVLLIACSGDTEVPMVNM